MAVIPGGPDSAQRVSSMATLPAPLADGLSRLTSDLESGVLTPADVGVRFYASSRTPGGGRRPTR